jgi:hypothetical protein
MPRQSRRPLSQHGPVRRRAGQFGTRNRILKVVRIGPGGHPEVPESGDELLRLSETISLRQEPFAPQLTAPMARGGTSARLTHSANPWDSRISRKRASKFSLDNAGKL